MHSNTDIFEFKFVDRDLEKNKVNEFIQSENNVLWIDGIHGVGKSYFIEKYIIPKMQLHYEYIVYVNKSANEPTNYLEILLRELSRILPTPFGVYIQKKYKQWKNIAKNISKALSDIDIFKSEAILINLLLDSDGIFLSGEGQNQGASKVLDMYLEDVVLNASAFIILDNFSYCDQESLQVMEEMFVSLRGIKDINFLICTTTEEREKKSNLSTFICDKLAHTYISMDKLNDSIYFKEIMTDKFKMTQNLFENIDEIHKICKGIPDNLRNFIRQLYIKEGIQISCEGFSIIEEKAIELIYGKEINFDPSTLDTSQTLIVQILALYHRPMAYNMLEDFITSINNDEHQNLFIFKMVNNRLFSIVETLLNNKILSIKIENRKEFLSFEDDNIFNVLYNYFSQEKSGANVAFVHYLLFQFVDKQISKMSNYGLDESDIQWILAEQSFYARIDNWEQNNAKLAFQLYKENKIYQCNQILSRFRKASKDIDTELRLLMAKVFYEVAEYNACIQMLDLLNIDILSDTDKFSFYLLYGKAVSFKSSQKALDNFLKALKLNITFEQKCLLQYYCEMSYSEISGCIDKAKKIFFEFYNDRMHKETKIYASVLRSSANLFEPQKSLKYLQEGLKKAQNISDILEEAKILNNIGYTYTRIEDYNAAEKYFELSCKKIENIKPFETSYPLTNLAFICMVKQDWEKALYLIEMASIYNKTEFIPIVIKTCKMLCYAELNRLEAAEELKIELIELIENNVISDYKMIKKCKLNCSYIANKLGDIETKERLLRECWPLVKNTFAEERYVNLCKKMGSQTPVKSNQGAENNFDLYDKINFEPWIVTFGHD